MVGVGLLMLGIGLWSLWARWRARSTPGGAALVRAGEGPSGFVAVLAGWITTEAGRQPFTVYGLLRTADSASPLAAPAVASSLLAFVVVYFIVFGMGVIYILRLMHLPPHHGETGPRDEAPARAAGITPAPALASRGYR